MSNSISKITNPMINGFEKGFSMVSVLIGGVTLVTSCQSINYSDSVAWENLYGAGSAPTARGRGNYTAEASISFLHSDLAALIRAVRNEFPDSITNSLSDLLPFDILVVYGSDLGSGAPTTDIIKNVQFINTPLSTSQSDASIVVDCQLICSHIVWGEPV